MKVQVKQHAAAVKYLMLLCGAAILSFGLYNVHSQSQITEGGVLGMTLFLNHWFGISPGISSPVMDIACYLLGIRYLGKSFLKYALTASLGFAAFYSLWEHAGYLLPDLGRQPVLAAIAGGLFVGTGVGLIVRAGGASGGDDALALVISKISGWKLSYAYFFTDFVVLMLSLTYIPITKILCSLITVTISSWLIGRIHVHKKR